MDANDWTRVQDLFFRSLGQPPASRRAFLEQACDGDEQLLHELTNLLGLDEGTSPLDGSLDEFADATFNTEEPIGRCIGPYHILSTLGRGGTSVVYLAEREDIGSRVAIKILRDAWISPERRARFAAEERTLAALDHPSIARLYDAASLPDGTPYFVMEYVEGRPLTDFCLQAQCSLVERMRIFRAVCDVVRFAHGRAVIHRDLKPSNILVADGSDVDAPAVKLLDFGIAKRIEESGSELQTLTSQRMLTPAYAAPEQLRGGVIDVFTDVYALGVILYELLTGRRPYDVAELSPAEAELRIARGAAEPPSSLIRTSAEPQLRRLGAARRLWADLDVICLKAMHPEPQRRYQSVEALMRDVDHFLADEPLEARPDSTYYRISKFARRHRRAMIGSIVMLFAITGLISFYTWQLADARDHALAEATRSDRIQRFVIGLFDNQGGAGPADSLRVVNLLESGVQEAYVLDSEPSVQADLFETLGGIYQSLGDFPAADSLLRAALARRESAFGRQHPLTAQSLVALGLLRSEQALHDEADELIREAIELGRKSRSSGDADLARALAARGSVLQRQGDYDEAAALLEDAVRMLSARPESAEQLSRTLSDLANTYFYAGRYEKSDSLNRLILAMDRRLYGRRHPFVASTLVNLGATRAQLGYPADAEQLYRQALEMYLAYYGDDHHLTASNMMMLAQVLVAQNRLDEAESLLEPALEIRERVYGPNHPRVATTLSELGTLAHRQSRLDDAERRFGRMLAIYRQAHGDNHYHVGIALANLASIYRDQQRLQEAEASLRQAIGIFLVTLGEDHIQTGIGRAKLGRLLLQQGRLQEAQVALEEALAILSPRLNTSSPWIIETMRDLTSVHERLGEPDVADTYRGQLMQVTQSDG